MAGHPLIGRSSGELTPVRLAMVQEEGQHIEGILCGLSSAGIEVGSDDRVDHLQRRRGSDILIQFVEESPDWGFELLPGARLCRMDHVA